VHTLYHTIHGTVQWCDETVYTEHVFEYIGLGSVLLRMLLGCELVCSEWFAYTLRHCHSAITPRWPLVLLVRLTVDRLRVVGSTAAVIMGTAYRVGAWRAVVVAAIAATGWEAPRVSGSQRGVGMRCSCPSAVR
jgi:hypothetical protein